MSVHVRYPRFVGETLAVRHRYFLQLLIAVAMLAIGLVEQGGAADLMIEFRNRHWVPISPAEIEQRAMPPPAPPHRPEPEPVQRQASPPPPPEAMPTRQRPSKPAYKPAKSATRADASYTPTAAAASPGTWLEAFVGFAWDFVRYTFYVLAVFVVLVNTRRILGFIDSVFEAAPDVQPTIRPAHDLQTEAVAAAMTLDLRDLVQSEFSAADIRKQTETLRALKDQLDAELKAARATIRRERAKVQQQQT